MCTVRTKPSLYACTHGTLVWESLRKNLYERFNSPETSDSAISLIYYIVAVFQIVVLLMLDDVAAEAGITKNVGSHTLRKTFGRFIFHEATDKNKALVILQTIFNHSSPAVTSRYIGLTDDEVSDVFNELNIGIDYI